MTASTLEKIFTEIFPILKTKEYHLTIIECDDEIQKIYETKTIEDVNFEVNGGGTSYIPVIEYINQNKKYRKSLLIYFTDGMGDEQIPYPLVYRMLWVLTSDKRRPYEGVYLSFIEPYGEVISMDVV